MARGVKRAPAGEVAASQFVKAGEDDGAVDGTRRLGVAGFEPPPVARDRLRRGERREVPARLAYAERVPESRRAADVDRSLGEAPPGGTAALYPARCREHAVCVEQDQGPGSFGHMARISEFMYSETMTDYPNREHQREDETARQRAVADLQDIINDAKTLQRRLANGTYTDVSDAQTLVARAAEVTRRLAVLDTLRQVREWHAADQAEETAR